MGKSTHFSGLQYGNILGLPIFSGWTWNIQTESNYFYSKGKAGSQFYDLTTFWRHINRKLYYVLYCFTVLKRGCWSQQNDCPSLFGVVIKDILIIIIQKFSSGFSIKRFLFLSSSCKTILFYDTIGTFCYCIFKQRSACVTQMEILRFFISCTYALLLH